MNVVNCVFLVQPTFLDTSNLFADESLDCNRQAIDLSRCNLSTIGCIGPGLASIFA